MIKLTRESMLKVEDISIFDLSGLSKILPLDDWKIDQLRMGLF